MRPVSFSRRPMAIELIMTKHFAERMVERGFTADEVINTIRNGVKTRNVRNGKVADTYRLGKVKVVTAPDTYILVSCIRLKKRQHKTFTSTKHSRKGRLGRKGILRRLQDEEE
jgi:Domain of unknown function (DUF4258)